MVKRKAEGIAPLRTEKDWDEDDIDETRDRMIRELNLDVTYAEFPSKERREWSIAQAHLIKQRVMGKDGESKDGEEMPGKDELHEMNVLDDVGDEMSAQMHQNVIDKLQGREPLYQSQIAENLFEDLLHEKSYNLDALMKREKDVKKELSEVTDQVVSDRGSFKESKVEMDDLGVIDEAVIEGKIEELMAQTMSGDVGKVKDYSQLIQKQSETIGKIGEQAKKRPAFFRRKT